MINRDTEADDFRTLLSDTVRSTYPAHEHDRFLGHFGGLMDA